MLRTRSSADADKPALCHVIYIYI